MTTTAEMVQHYINAEIAVLEGKSYGFNGRTFTSENLADIRAGRVEWEAKLRAEQAGQSRQRRFSGAGVKIARFNCGG